MRSYHKQGKSEQIGDRHHSLIPACYFLMIAREDNRKWCARDRHVCPCDMSFIIMFYQMGGKSFQDKSKISEKYAWQQELAQFGQGANHCNRYSEKSEKVLLKTCGLSI